MTATPYVIRNYRPADFSAYLELKSDVVRQSLYHALGENLPRPDYVPEEDLFVVEGGKRLVGYLDVIPELRIGRVILDCLVHPSYRRKGIATELFLRAEHRAGNLGAREVHVSIPQKNVSAQEFLSNRGFAVVRRFLELRQNLSRTRSSEIDSAATSCRCLQCGEEACLVTEGYRHQY